MFATPEFEIWMSKFLLSIKDINKNIFPALTSTFVAAPWQFKEKYKPKISKRGSAS
jgi:hypothetical protein